jgi:response regulator RpfG family c-di-GMP phosphodiesterase
MVSGIHSTMCQAMFATIDVSKRYVLVVEDNNMISEILVHTMKELGYEAVTAHNGRIAVEKFNCFMREG